MGSGLPLAIPDELVPVASRAVDAGFMRGLLERDLTYLAGVPVRVVRCRPKPLKSRRVLAQGRLRIAYYLSIEWPGGEGERTLLATLPADDEAHDAKLRTQSRALEGHPAVRPFRELTTVVDDLRMSLSVFPVDPDLPALAVLTGPQAAAVLEPFVAECRGGDRIADVRWELRHYKPWNRAVLRMTAALAGGGRRRVYVKLFSDDRGAASHRHLEALWKAARRSGSLRIPEPLGYEPSHRMLVMAEAPGARDLTEWIKCIEKGRALPDGVDLARLRRGVAVAAEALAELHGADLPLDGRRTGLSELADLRRELEMLRGGAPELEARIEGLLEALEARTRGLNGERLVPSHGGFRHKQTVGDERSLTVIDWDGLTLANPALDAATFERRLLQEPLRRPGSAGAMLELAEVFRRRFLTCEPEVSEEELDLYLAISLAENALRTFRRPKKRRETIEECGRILDHAESLLGDRR